LYGTAWWGWEDLNFQPNGYEPPSQAGRTRTCNQTIISRWLIDQRPAIARVFADSRLNLNGTVSAPSSLPQIFRLLARRPVPTETAADKSLAIAEISIVCQWQLLAARNWLTTENKSDFTFPQGAPSGRITNDPSACEVPIQRPPERYRGFYVGGSLAMAYTFQ
jgi:hypothetical protein